MTALVCVCEDQHKYQVLLLQISLYFLNFFNIIHNFNKRQIQGLHSRKNIKTQQLYFKLSYRDQKDKYALRQKGLSVRFILQKNNGVRVDGLSDCAVWIL